MKKYILKVANVCSFFWKLIPFKIREFIFTSLFILESRDRNPNFSLKRIFKIKDKLEWIINERAISYDKGLHPKHRITGYHSFFINRIKSKQKILDVGCGNGSVAIDIAYNRPSCEIIGIDINQSSINKAKLLLKNSKLKNVSFKKIDISNDIRIDADVIILSNVLEHIENRIEFLNNIYKLSRANQFLIRVPLFERDWQIPLRKELGIYFFSDLDHKTEHTVNEFEKEMKMSNLKINEIKTLWGEIWASCNYEI